MVLSGKVAVITGGVRDIGRSITLAMADAGAKLVVNYYADEEGAAENAAETVRLAKEKGADIITVPGDLMKAKDVENVIAQSVEAFGEKVDVLVNVAGGIIGRKKIEEQDEDWYNLLMDLNMKTVWSMTKAVRPYLGEGGSIVNFASQAGRDGAGAGASLYGASKAAVMGFTRAMAKELGSIGVRCNAICPGMIATKFHDDHTPDQARVNVAAATALRREGRAEEVADLVVYLASEKSSFMSGNNIDINGGLAFS
ncbi:SDR family NAD(P)-dependent oxidoreductase [Flammeovirga kamogawensis]|uniref:SDR family oxidoreductase n=1 Tax=Flammeovirga kamogawensis TaxID=373891 RepID=A0ABX8H4J9_9BACT|nr:SDR family oxidoreductase [Flammeovirga kamogawensis]MBB6463120.1 3-oxoacyl-[acyl-carrier protein] reductase [Flammeovirga kamogawensis]QWG10356.1 SDR family oxidoreductase [Flammeovirga kamogawensis]TRX63866.1 SDR family oxidoreductase [Flammeovirga kamogawensis]